MKLNIFSDLRKPWLVPGESLSPAQNYVFCFRETLFYIRTTSFCKGCLFSNNTKILLFISNMHSYVPIKLCRLARKIYLFQIKGRLSPEKVKLKKNWIWDVLEIDWSDIIRRKV